MKESRSHKGTGDADIFMGVQLCKRGLDSYRLSAEEKEKPRKVKWKSVNEMTDLTRVLLSVCLLPLFKNSSLDLWSHQSGCPTIGEKWRGRSIPKGQKLVNRGQRELGFVVVDEEMRERHHLQWTRNLVESNRRKERCKDPKVRNAGECNSHVGGRMGKEEEKQVGEVLMVSLEESSLPAYATMMSTLVPKDKEACGSCFQKPYPSTDLALLVKASLCVTSQLSSSSFAKGFLLGQPRTVKLKSRLEKLQRDFLWGGGELQRRPHLVNWSIVCLDKKDVIIGKYEKKEGGWCSRASREGYVVGLWKAIQSWWKGFNNRVGFRVGNGRRVWEGALGCSFLEFFNSIDGNRLGKLVARIQGSQDR
ncbi:hypothetical protein CK203_017105 [Vitis vinifera]|uniref:Uncharacterized protein n=1 Tax=Vitis vinifera TaxID=29760 RepID=A0A438JZW2_VITVI|nr:hypothetical protein CK203_017105 [Vitis vinifera]